MQPPTTRQDGFQRVYEAPEGFPDARAACDRSQSRTGELDYTEVVRSPEVETTPPFDAIDARERLETIFSQRTNQASRKAYDTSTFLDARGQRKNGRGLGNDAHMGTGKAKAPGKPTKAAWRLHWLFVEMLKERTPDNLPRFASQQSMSEWLGLSKQYVGQIVNLETSGVLDVKAGTIEHLMHRVGLLPDWFFAEWAEDEERPSYRDYLASTKRLARSVQTLERKQVAYNQTLEELMARVAELEAERGGPALGAKRKRGR